MRCPRVVLKIVGKAYLIGIYGGCGLFGRSLKSLAKQILSVFTVDALSLDSLKNRVENIFDRDLR